jgi:hypothetical protein
VIFLEKNYEDGHFNLCTLGRLNIPVAVEKIWNIYMQKNVDALPYNVKKELYQRIPKEKRNIPYFTEGNVVLIVLQDANRVKTIKNLEKLKKRLVKKWNVGKKVSEDTVLPKATEEVTHFE